MAQSTARARHLPIAPRKLRLVANLVRGKKVTVARDILAVTARGGAPYLRKVLASAVANAENKAAERRQRLDTDDMVITRLLVDGGLTRRKYHTVMRGRGVRLRCRTSHVQLVISDGIE